MPPPYLLAPESEATPSTGTILSTLNSDDIVTKVQLAKLRMLNLIHN